MAETKAAEQKKETEAQANQTPDYAAGLVSSNILVSGCTVQPLYNMIIFLPNTNRLQSSLMRALYGMLFVSWPSDP